MVGIKLKTKIKKHKDVKKILNNMGKSVYVGYPEDSPHPDSELNNAQIAFLNTQGTLARDISKTIRENMNSQDVDYYTALNAYIRSKGDPRHHIPPRPFIEPTIEDNQDLVINYLGRIIKEELNGNIPEELYKRLGIDITNRIRKFMLSYPGNNLTPNAPSTIEKKGEDHPLKGETGELIRGLTYIIESNK